MKKNSFVLACAAAIILAAGWSAAQQQGSRRLTPEDHIEIEQLYQAYQRGVDGGPRDASWVFTPDGEFVAGRTVRGEKELKEFYANLNKTHSPRVRRLLSNIVMTPTSTGVDGSAYLFTIDVRDSAQIVYYGVYEDKLVKTRDGWRIKQRVYRQDWPQPAASQPR